MQPRSVKLAFEPARVDTGSEDEHGILVLADRRLVAILIRLDSPIHNGVQGRWYLEAGFGRCAGSPAPFVTASDGLRWVAGRLGGEVSNLAQVLAEVGAAFSPAAGDQGGFGSRP